MGDEIIKKRKVIITTKVRRVVNLWEGRDM